MAVGLSAKMIAAADARGCAYIGRAFRAAALLSIVPFAVSCTSPGLRHLAIANGNVIRVVDADTTQSLHEVTRYTEVMRLAYRPDGERLAVGVCFGNRVVELDTTSYAELGVATTAWACPWDAEYAPDTQSLAVARPFRPSAPAALFGHLWIGGPQPLDRDMGLPLRALAYRPGGSELAVSTPTGLAILSTAAGYPEVTRLANVTALSLGYTPDGARLIVGIPAGFQVLDAAAGYATLSTDTAGGVIDVAVAPSGGFVALVRGTTVSVRRTADLGEVASLSTTVGFRDADFSHDGALLAVAEQSGQVRRFRAPSWQELSAIALTGRVDAVAFRPRGFGQRIPVVFVHGHTGDAVAAWMDTAGGTSFAAALAANPGLQLDAFYLQLPVHGGSDPAIQSRGIEDDAQDILALIEGGADSRGGQQVGILNMPAYAGVGRVALVGYSQGTLSSRYYLKNLMGSRRPGVNVAEFVALAAPNHGVGGLVSCGDVNEPDRALRQLCAGHVATAVSLIAPCGSCPGNIPAAFALDPPGGNTFILDLNGHPLSDSCTLTASPSEAPSSRPATPNGVLYVNLFADTDTLVGGATQSGDCFGRRLARNLAPDAVNVEVTGVPGGLAAHANVPHHWPIICFTLRTITDHVAPADLAQACTGLTQP